MGNAALFRRKQHLLTALFILAFMTVLLRNAWLSDDAYITFRTVDNFINGYGLTWNVGERVQAFTHPLWLFLVSICYFCTREIYYTSIFLSCAITLCTVVVFAFRAAGSSRSAVLGICLLVLSKAFVDYSTSGLENALTHLLLVLFLMVFLEGGINSRKLLLLSLIAAFGLVNRMDTALLFVPVIIYATVEVRRVRAVYSILAGLTPFLFWEAFSWFYYGFFFPNTAYAKLNTGIRALPLIVQGLYYLRNSIMTDHLTLAVIAAGLLAFLVNRDKRMVPVAAGIILYLMYVVKIGGDFMSGRFLAAPFLCAVVLLSRCEVLFSGRLSYAGAWGVALLLGLSTPNPPVLSGADYGKNRDDRLIKQGICDERAYYYQWTGLLNSGREGPWPAGDWADQGRELRKKREKFLMKNNIGMVGFFAGPHLYLLDPMALADPLLARLPAMDTENWRIGHFERWVPGGYPETLQTGRHRIEDPALAEYYDKLTTVVHGDLFSPARLREIWSFLSGNNDSLIRQYKQRFKLVRVDGALFDPASRAFDYISRCLRYDRNNMPDSSYLVHLEMQHRGIEPGLQEREQWGKAMLPYMHRHYENLGKDSALLWDLLVVLRYYWIVPGNEEVAGGLYMSMLGELINHQTLNILTEYIVGFDQQALWVESAERALRLAENGDEIRTVLINLAGYYDITGFPDSASVSYLRIRRRGIDLSATQKSEWLSAMESRAAVFREELARSPSDVGYLVFFLRYYWLKQDSEGLREISERILSGDFSPSGRRRLLEMAGALGYRRLLDRMQRPAAGRNPGEPGLREPAR
ncbi:MAG: hypothetical protein JXQ83_12230 [Candidatus Glassbacteria bacterium]|nr:hypothetical protein [Candidatus Glassbacteria bacterium]